MREMNIISYNIILWVSFSMSLPTSGSQTMFPWTRNITVTWECVRNPNLCLQKFCGLDWAHALTSTPGDSNECLSMRTTTLHPVTTSNYTSIPKCQMSRNLQRPHKPNSWKIKVVISLAKLVPPFMFFTFTNQICFITQFISYLLLYNKCPKHISFKQWDRNCLT